MLDIGSRFRPSPKSIDWIAGLVLFVLGPIPALQYFVDSGYTFFNQTLTPESVLWACGQGLRHPNEVIDPLFQFLSGEALEFDCKDLGTLDHIGEASLYAKLQPYFTWTAASLWGAFGVSYLALVPLIWLLYGSYVAGSYAVARQFLGRWLSLTTAMMLAMAPLAVGMTTYLRDFSKAPFFIWAVFLTVRAIRASELRLSLIYASFAATVIGIGYGFRNDMVVMVPIGALALAIGTSVQAGGPKRLLRAAPMVVPTIFVIVYTVVAMPIWSQISIGGFGGTFAMQGATEPFRIATGREAAGYTIGWAYSDELTLSGVAAAERLADPNWDLNEQNHVPVYGISGALSRATAHFLQWADLFAADFMAQGIKSAGWVLGLPAFVARTPYVPEFPAAQRIQPYSPLRVTVWLYALIGQVWFVYAAAAAALLFLFQRYVRSRREAFALMFLLGGLIVYPGIQFSLRHVFHLEIIWLIALLSLPSLTRLKRNHWRLLPRFLVQVAVGCLVVYAIYVGALCYQQSALERELNKLLSGASSLMEVTEIVGEKGDRFFAVAVPRRYESVVDAPYDALVPISRFRGIRWDVRAAADRLLVQVGGAECRLDGLSIQAHYTHTPETWQPFDAELNLLSAPASATVSFILPAFYRSTQHFSGIMIPAAAAECDVSIKRLDGESRLPFVFTATLDGDSLLGPRYQSIGLFDRQQNPSTITARVNRKNAATFRDKGLSVSYVIP